MILDPLLSCAFAHIFVLLYSPGASVFLIPNKNIYYSTRKKSGKNTKKKIYFTVSFWQKPCLDKISVAVQSTWLFLWLKGLRWAAQSPGRRGGSHVLSLPV